MPKWPWMWTSPSSMTSSRQIWSAGLDELDAKSG
jgi:hypothetical protein